MNTKNKKLPKRHGRTITLKQVLEACERASEQVKLWPKWKRDLSYPERKEDES